MSLSYNFVTPLTSMVITKPGQEQSQVAEKPGEDGGCGSRILTQHSPQPLPNMPAKTPPLPPTDSQKTHPCFIDEESEARPPDPRPYSTPRHHMFTLPCVALGLGNKVKQKYFKCIQTTLTSVSVFLPLFVLFRKQRQESPPR